MTATLREAAEPTTLLGHWRLSRRISDLRTGGTGTVQGLLSLCPDDGGVSWEEHGTLSWNGRDVPVWRSYLFRQDAAGWWLHFSDGRPFHPWLPGEWVEHPCRQDIYRGMTTIISDDEWQVRWEVDGPMKSQRIVTRLHRAPEDLVTLAAAASPHA